MDTEETNTLNRRQIGGISIILGNAALFANGLIAHMHGHTPEVRSAGTGRMASGALYMGVGGIIARYGNPSAARQLATLEERLAGYLHQHGVPLDGEQLAAADREMQKHWFAKLEDFVYDHPIECANVYNALASTGMLASGILRRRRGEYTAGNANIASYAMIMAGTLVSVLTKELTPEQIAKKGQTGTLWGNVQQQPLNYAVWPYLAGDLSFGAQALGEYKMAKELHSANAFKPWALGMAGISAFVTASSFVGDVLTGFSSKKVSSDPQERDMARAELTRFAAQILAQQPLETRQTLAEHAAEYLTHQQGLRMADLDKDQLTAQIMDAAQQSLTPSPQTQSMGMR